MSNSKKMIGYIGLIIANFMAMFLISGIGVLGYAVAGEYEAVASVGMVFTLESAARCAIMPISGKLGEKFGRKQLFIFAMIVYTVCYALCFIVPGFWAYVILRTITGFAWALWVTNGFVILNDIFGSENATKYSGYAQAASTVAMLIAAPLAGVFCATSFGWRLEYMIATPIMIVAIILSIIGIPKSTKTQSGAPMDMGGVIGTILFLIPFGLAMAWGPSYGWGSKNCIVAIVLAVIGVIILIVSEAKAKDPIFPMRVLKNKFYLSLFIISLSYSIANAAFNYIPTYMQYYGGIDSVRAGLVTTPALIIAAILTVVFGNMAAKSGKYKGLVVIWTIGSIISGIMFFFMDKPFVASMMFVYCLIGIIPLGAVNSCQQIVPYTYPINVLKPEEIAIGMSFMGVGGVFGNTIANGVLGAIMNSPAGMPAVFKVILPFSIVMLILTFVFKDVKKGETL